MLFIVLAQGLRFGKHAGKQLRNVLHYSHPAAQMPHYKQNGCFCLNWQLLLNFMPDSTLRIKIHYSQNYFGKKYCHYFTLDDKFRPAFYFVYGACLQSKEGAGK